MKRPRTLSRCSPDERRRKADAERAEAKPWRGWYGLAAWKRRRDEQLGKQPLCERHLKRGEVVQATVANHVIPHRGNWKLFIGGELESVCKPCHDSEVQAEEKAAGRRAIASRGRGV